MRTLDQSLAMLVEKDLVEKEHAQSRAKDPHEFLRMLNLAKEAKEKAEKAGGQAAVTAPPEPPPVADGQEPPKPSAVRGQPNRPGFKRD
jgi:hypothetical protein